VERRSPNRGLGWALASAGALSVSAADGGSPARGRAGWSRASVGCGSSPQAATAGSPNRRARVSAKAMRGAAGDFGNWPFGADSDSAGRLLLRPN